MKNYILAAGLLLGGLCPATGQTLASLQKGDTLPNLPLTIHYGDSTVQTTTAAYRGKALLLDFWSTHCGSCISGMEDMTRLQQKFDTALNIVVVTADPPAQVSALWERLSRISHQQKWPRIAKKLPFVKGDTAFHELFPHLALPLHVWIDPCGVVRSISYAKTTNATTMAAFIKGEPVKWDEQRLLKIDAQNPLVWISQAPTLSDSLTSGSFLVPGFDYGLGATSGRQFFYPATIGTPPSRISCMNQTALELYEIAYSNWWKGGGGIPQNRLHLGAGVASLLAPATQENNTLARYSYGLAVPPSHARQSFTYMQRDLDRYFGLRSRVEARSVKCLVLKRVKGADKLKSRSKEVVFKQDKELIIRKLPFEQVVTAVNAIAQPQLPRHVILDETGYKGLVDVTLPWKEEAPDTISLPALRRALARYGLQLEEGYRKVEQLVIEKDF